MWEELWGLPRFEAWSSIGSTNDRVRALARDGARAFTTVVADEQTAGRGRGGRQWVSPAGRGLWMSVLLRLRPEPARALAPLYLGLAVCRAVERLRDGASPALKWPNDVLLSGRKVAGVLCESADEVVVAGIGVNVSTAPEDLPSEVAGRAASLAELPGGPPSRSELAGALLAEVRPLLSGAPPAAALEEIRTRDALRGHAIEVDGVRGVGAGIDESGRLLVRAGEVVRPVVAGSVRLVSEAERERTG